MGAALLWSVALGGCGGGSDMDRGEDTDVPSTSTDPPASGGSSGGPGSSSPADTVPASTPSGAGRCPVFSPSELLAALNAARAQARQCGATGMPAAAALSWNSALASAASRHSTDMATHNFFSHTGSDGSQVGQRASAAGYGWTAVGENIAAGPSSVSAAMSGWLASPGHCANIMGGAYRHVGVACVASADSVYPRYWTMVLARP